MQNNDLISRAAAIAELMQMVKVHGELLHYTGIKAMLESLTAVDAVPVVHGRWVPDTWRGNDIMSGGSMATCSECGKGWLDTRRMRFCPNCGAKMDGGEGE